MNYSITPMVVNLAERTIAKKNGTLDDFEPIIKYGARAQYTGKRDSQDMAREISRSCTVQRADVMAVLSAFEEEIKSCLLDGWMIDLAPLGKLKMSAEAEGSNAAALVVLDDAKIRLNLRFVPSDDSKEEAREGKWHLRPGRKARRAAIAEMKKQ